MAKKTRHFDDPDQPTLFDLLEERSAEINQEPTSMAEGCLNMQSTMKSALNAALKATPLSRFEVAGQMSHLLGIEISKFSIDTWTAESKDAYRIPAEYLPAFCRVTGSMEPVRLVAEAAGIFAMPGPDALRAEIQRLDEEARRLASEKRKRVLFLQEMSAGQKK